MSETERRCPECNAVCGENDTYCKKCGKSFVAKTVRVEEEYYFDPDDTINDVPASQVALKVQKNIGRYLKIFKKNEDAKYFGSFNFCAALFSINWFFYRKMYKIGVIICLITSVVMSLSAVLGALVYYDSFTQIYDGSAEYEEAKAYVDSFYDEYLDSIEVYYSQAVNNPDAEPPEEYQKYLEAQEIISEKNREARAVLGKFYTFPVLAGLLCMAFTGIFADCIYRNYLFNKKREESGGVSRWWMYILVAKLTESGISYVGIITALVIAFTISGTFGG